jgi:hypothetical protein
MTNRIFDCYILPTDPGVVFVGLRNWIAMGDNSAIPMIGVYFSNERHVNERFDILEADLKRCRSDALSEVRRMQRKNPLRIVQK